MPLNLHDAGRLTSCYFVAPDTGERLDVLGPEPFPARRVWAQRMIAYTGRWSPDEEKLPGRKVIGYVDWEREEDLGDID